MSDVSRCEHSECIHRDECYRYTESKGVVIEFKNICNEENGYERLMKINKDVEVKKDE